MDLQDRYYMILEELDIEEETFQTATPQEVRNTIAGIKELIKLERNEEVIAAQQIDVELDETYVVNLLPLSQERKWRQKVVNKFKELRGSINLSGLEGKTNEDPMIKGFEYLLVNFEGDLWDLFFEYCPDIPKETILEIAENSFDMQEKLNDAAINVFKTFFFPRLAKWKRRMLTLPMGEVKSLMT